MTSLEPEGISMVNIRVNKKTLQLFLVLAVFLVLEFFVLDGAWRGIALMALIFWRTGWGAESPVPALWKKLREYENRHK